MTIKLCETDGCYEPAVASCDNCDAVFCEEHGRLGGDRQVAEVGAVAYPSMCEACQRRAA
jgi:hypothetical protein